VSVMKFSLAFGLLAVINKSLILGMRNMARKIDHKYTLLLITRKIDHKYTLLLITNMAAVINVD
jgi:hypothetical protein